VELDIPVREKPLTLEDVLGAEEMFLSNSMIELIPVVRIGREVIGNEKPGEITRKLAVAFTELTLREASNA